MEFYYGGSKAYYDPLGKHGKYLAVLFAGCDFNCPFCYNTKILQFKKESLVDIKKVKYLILSSEAKGIVFSGAEPCLQKQALFYLVKACKKKGMRSILLTNGSRPKTIALVIASRLFDTIVLDLKSPLDHSYQRLTRSETYFMDKKDILDNIEETLDIFKKDRSTEKLITTTIIPGLLYRKEELLKIAALIKDIDCTWHISPFIPGIAHDKRLMNLKSPGIGLLRGLKNIIQREYPSLRIRLDS